MLKFLGNRRKGQLLKSLLSDPLPEGHRVDRDSFFCLIPAICHWTMTEINSKRIH